MIHYHGGPLACPNEQVARILHGKHACVSYAVRSQLPIVQEFCQSWMLDNGAYSFWNSGKSVNWEKYYQFIEDLKDPSLDFWIIPDVIGGTEQQNNDLIRNCPLRGGTPVWHFDESLEKLSWLAEEFPRICIGTTEGLNPNTEKYWERMNQAMDCLCVDGKISIKVHGLRCLNPEIFTKVPLASADSTMVARNMTIPKWESVAFKPNSLITRAVVLMDRIESFNAPKTWSGGPVQLSLFGA